MLGRRQVEPPCRGGLEVVRWRWRPPCIGQEEEARMDDEEVAR